MCLKEALCPGFHAFLRTPGLGAMKTRCLVKSKDVLGDQKDVYYEGRSSSSCNAFRKLLSLLTSSSLPSLSLPPQLRWLCPSWAPKYCVLRGESQCGHRLGGEQGDSEATLRLRGNRFPTTSPPQATLLSSLALWPVCNPLEASGATLLQSAEYRNPTDHCPRSHVWRWTHK